METRPQITLITKDGARPIECTVKEPTIKNDREFRSAGRDRNNAPTIYNACNKEAAAVSDALGALQKKLEETDDAEAKAKLAAEVERGQKNLDVLEKRMQEADVEYYDRFCRHAFSILEPVAEGVELIFDAIDWEQANMQKLNGVINFFRDSSRTSV